MTTEQLRTFLESEYGLQPGSRDPFVRSVDIASGAKVGSNVRFGRGVVVHSGVEIGDDVAIGDRVTLRNCRLANGVRVEDNGIIGYATLTGGFSHQLEERKEVRPTVIGEETLVRTGCVVYQSVTIGAHAWINHSVLLREHTVIGDGTCIGSMTDCEGYTTVGSHCLIHSQVHLCARLTIEDYVFVAPFTIFANGHPMSYAREIDSPEQGGVVRFGAQLAVSVMVMPRIEIGAEAWVGPGTVVGRNVDPLSRVIGSPMRVLTPVTEELRMPLELRRRYYGGAADPPAGHW